MAKKIRLEFTGPELNQLYGIMLEVIDVGDYYAPREQYYARNQSILNKISDGLGLNEKCNEVK